jgi:general secretion pathway protein G
MESGSERKAKLEIRNWKLARRKSEFPFSIFQFPFSNFQRAKLAGQTSEFPVSSFQFPISGFTLIELMVVITLILILATFAMPMYHVAVVHAREAVLRDDLFTMRKMIDEYTIDKQHPPTSLDELVDGGYLRGGIPVDPMTGSNQTWKTDMEDVPISADQSASGIVDVHSGAEDNSLDGTAYSSW